MSGKVQIKLSMPPTANRMFVNVPHRGYRAKAQAYRVWSDAAALEVCVQRRGQHFVKPVKATVRAEAPKRRRDLDNILKPLFDAMERGGVVENDRLIMAIDAAWSMDVTGVECTLEAI